MNHAHQIVSASLLNIKYCRRISTDLVLKVCYVIYVMFYIFNMLFSGAKIRIHLKIIM